MNKSKIQWTESTWNPVTGCTKISEGCKNCYAEVMTWRLKAMGQEKYKDGFDKVVCHYESNKEPFRWKKGRKIFVCSMSDLFHEDVPYDFINKVFNVIRFNPQHTFQILTKRASRIFTDAPNGFYPDNLWMGVTVENQKQANERIPHLMKSGAKVKFLSIEPMLGPVDLTNIPHFKDHLHNQYYRDVINQKSISGDDITYYPGQIDWVIVGGETGPKARPMHPDWVRSIRDQCKEAGVPFFFKQWGEWACRYADSDIVREDRSCKKWPNVTRLSYSGKYGSRSSLTTEEDQSSVFMQKVGRKIAGDLLDGIQHHEFPEISTSAHQHIN